MYTASEYYRTIILESKRSFPKIAIVISRNREEPPLGLISLKSLKSNSKDAIGSGLAVSIEYYQDQTALNVVFNKDGFYSKEKIGHYNSMNYIIYINYIKY